MVSRANLIIIVVAAAVAGLVLLALCARAIARGRAVSNPLPPVQPLAHHKEQQLLPVPSPVGSRASLIQHSSYTDDSAPVHSLPLPAPFLHSSGSSLTSDDHSSPDREQHPPSTPTRRISSHRTIRGTPHSRYSQVQIVLPTPLSPELSSRPDLSRRRSVVDQWVSGTAAHGKSFSSHFVIRVASPPAFTAERPPSSPA